MSSSSEQITVKLKDGSITISAKIYAELSKQVNKLTGKTVHEVLTIITELTQQAL
jgi:hypothetical protein